MLRKTKRFEHQKCTKCLIHSCLKYHKSLKKPCKITKQRWCTNKKDQLLNTNLVHFFSIQGVAWVCTVGPKNSSRWNIIYDWWVEGFTKVFWTFFKTSLINCSKVKSLYYDFKQDSTPLCPAVTYPVLLGYQEYTIGRQFLGTTYRPLFLSIEANWSFSKLTSWLIVALMNSIDRRAW